MSLRLFLIVVCLIHTALSLNVHELSRSFLQDQHGSGPVALQSVLKKDTSRPQGLHPQSKKFSVLSLSNSDVSGAVSDPPRLLSVSSPVSAYDVHIKTLLNHTHIADFNRAISPFKLASNTHTHTDMNTLVVVGPACTRVVGSTVDLLSLPLLHNYTTHTNTLTHTPVSAEEVFLHFLSLLSSQSSVRAVTVRHDPLVLSATLLSPTTTTTTSSTPTTTVVTDGHGFTPYNAQHSHSQSVFNNQDSRGQRDGADAVVDASTSSSVDTVWIQLWDIEDEAMQYIYTHTNTHTHSDDGSGVMSLSSLDSTTVADFWNTHNSRDDEDNPCVHGRFTATTTPTTTTTTTAELRNRVTLTIPSSSRVACLTAILHSSVFVPLIASIQLRPVLSIQNNYARRVLLDTHLQTMSTYAHNVTGRGQIVIVGDTGVDHNHCMFHDLGRPTVTHVGKSWSTTPDLFQRKIVWYVTDYGDNGDDRTGHGSHVAGTIAGVVQHYLPNVRDKLSVHNGVARDARLVVLDMKRNRYNELNVPDNLYTGLFKPFVTKVDTGISSHSWGGESEYNSFSVDVDKWVWRNPYHLPIFAAGNSGTSGLHSVLSPSNSKNCLAVGASHNLYDSLVLKTTSTHAQVHGLDVMFKKASFGSTPNFNAKSAALVVPTDLLGCTPIPADPVYTDAVVVLRRGTCDFVTKANNAYAVGARGVVVVNKTPQQIIEMGSDNSVSMKFPNSFISMMVPQLIGEKLIAYLQSAPNSHGGNIAEPEGEGSVDGWHSVFITGPATTILGEAYPHTLADFSSRGPTLDGRIKPDIVAPGSNIRSANSDGDVTQQSNCNPDSGLATMSGTSMATPAVAGVTALLKQYLEDGMYSRYYSNITGVSIDTHMVHTNNNLQPSDSDVDVMIPNGSIRPSAAALKAVLVASVLNVGGQVSVIGKASQTVVPAPLSPYQGFGQVNLARVLALNHTTHTEPDTIDMPSSKLFLFDSVTEDVATIQNMARYHPTAQLKTLLSSVGLDEHASTLTSAEDLFDKVEAVLGVVGSDSVGQPVSLVSGSLLRNRCTGSDAQSSCALSAFSMHTHCLSVDVVDVSTLVTYTLANGATPVLSTTVQTIGGSSMTPLVFTSASTFQHRFAPYTPRPHVLRATLSWTDPPAPELSARVLIHDLDLVLHARSNAYIYVDISKGHVGRATVSADGTVSLSDITDIDWEAYRHTHSHFFTLTDQEIAKTNNGAMLTSPFIARVMKDHVSLGNDNFVGNANNESPVADRVNNVEQTALCLTSFNFNAYVLAAAARLNEQITATVSVRTNALTSRSQHYALAVTGGVPSYITQQPQQQQQPQQHTQSSSSLSLDTCTNADFSLFCPNNCSGHGSCIKGKCVCAVTDINHPEYKFPISTTYAGDSCAVSIDTLPNAVSACQQDPAQCLQDTLGHVMAGPAQATVGAWGWSYHILPKQVVFTAKELLGDGDKSNTKVMIGLRLVSSGGDADIYVSTTKPPTVTSFDKANVHCDVCSKPASLSQATGLLALQQRGGEVKTLDGTVLSAAQVSDPTVLWLDHDYLTQTQYDSVFVGVYGYCCSTTTYTLTAFALTTTEPTATDDYILYTVMLLLLTGIILVLGWRVLRRYFKQTPPDNVVLDPTTNTVVPQPPNSPPPSQQPITESVELANMELAPEDQPVHTKRFAPWNKRAKGKYQGLEDDVEDIETKYDLDTTQHHAVTHVIDDTEPQEDVGDIPEITNNPSSNEGNKD